MSEYTFCIALNFIIILLEAWIGYLVVEYKVTGGFWFMAFLLLFLQEPNKPENKTEDSVVSEMKIAEHNDDMKKNS